MTPIHLHELDIDMVIVSRSWQECRTVRQAVSIAEKLKLAHIIVKYNRVALLLVSPHSASDEKLGGAWERSYIHVVHNYM